MTAGVQPFETLRGKELGLLRWSIDRIRNECLAEAGYPQNLEHMATEPVDQFAYLHFDEGMFGPRTEEEARRSGFGKDVPAQLARIVSFDANYDRALKKCEDAAWAKAGEHLRNLVSGYIELGNTLMAEFSIEYEKLANQKLPGLRQALADCLEKAGYKPADRERFIAEPDPKQFGIAFGGLEGGEDTWQPDRKPGTVQVGPATPARQYRPTPAEADLAVAWHRCVRSAGFIETLMPLVYQAQEMAVKRHEDRLAEYAQQTTEAAKSVANLRWS